MDPVSQAFAAATVLVTTVDEIGQLIARLTDHQRTLDQAEADRRAASARLDAAGETPAKG